MVEQKAGRDTDLLWRRVERSFLNKIAYRDRELAELSVEFLEQQQLLAMYRAYFRRLADANDRARDEWRV